MALAPGAIGLGGRPIPPVPSAGWSIASSSVGATAAARRHAGVHKVINISSMAGVLVPEGHGAYAASKGGLNLLTQAMAAEWGRFNIPANAVAPTVILTEMGKQVWGVRPRGSR